MISKKMMEYVEGSKGNFSIRAMFEEGKRLAGIYGADKVYDFSLGNPSVEPPAIVKESIIKVLNREEQKVLHGYMNNSGYEEVRKQVADSLNSRFQTTLNQNNIIMTVGAAGGLNITLKALLNPGDEVIVFAPFFGEYRSYVSNFDGELVIVPAETKDFQPNLISFEKQITNKTKAVIVNSPNNPTGVVYSEDTIRNMADILNRKQEEFHNSIYLISDEPYRELVYEGAEVPYLTKYYKNTIVGYSFSKSLSLPGERIGYIVIPDEVDDYEDLFAAANIANRILGFVNAPSLMQKVAAACLDAEVNVEAYNTNRELLYHGLTEYGYQCIKPEGAFYLFVKVPGEDDFDFTVKAKEHRILLVPGSAFACPGYVRIAYCVTEETIKNALPEFKKLLEEYIQ